MPRNTLGIEYMYMCIVPADSPVPMLASEVAIQYTSVVFLSPLDNISVKLLAAVFNENYKSKN